MAMPRSPEQLREDLLAIWNAGVDGVRVEPLVRNAVSLENGVLRIGEDRFPLAGIGRIVVLGGGKASGAMAETLEDILEPLFGEKELLGWVNIPEDGPGQTKKIRLFPARPPCVNEPTEAGVTGTAEILRLAESLEPDDLCLCLISGGGSALLPAPISGISLADKLEITRFLSESGATIEELNTVRKPLSRIKGGGLKRICRGKRLISLILSDVLGDPLDVIASGPTVDSVTTAGDALAVLERFAPKLFETSTEKLSGRETDLLRVARFLAEAENRREEPGRDGGFVRNLVIGNNALAVDSAGLEAVRRGYSYAMYVAPKGEGQAEEVGVHLAELALEMRQAGPDCLIHGGEPVVRLADPAIRGKGGRNQQLVLAALIELLKRLDGDEVPGLALLSGGTDGEDGPTDAAGAWIDPIFLRDFRAHLREHPGFDPEDFLQRNDAYRFFEPLGTLLKTGPTGTNVCDLRIVLVDRIAEDGRY